METSSDCVTYEMCANCDHFIETNDPRDIVSYDVAPYIHLEDGEQEFDHDAKPSAIVRQLAQWKKDRPELFTTYADGKIGPNSVNFVGRGKV